MKSLWFGTVLWMGACSDYNLFEKNSNEDVEQTPILETNPSSLDMGVVCASGLEDSRGSIELSNVGLGVLSIQSLDIEGWVLLNNPTPLDLDPNDTLVLSVRPLNEETESGVLTVYSNDPAQDIVQIPLLAAVDEAPTLELISPVSGDVLEGETRFQAMVGDELDPSESLMVQWQSNQDGLFSTGEAFPDGSVETLWNAYQSSGYHTIEVSVVDSCSNVTRDTASICQQLTYNVNALDVNTWNFEGSARWDVLNSWVELTPASRWQVGTAFSTGQEVPAGWIDIAFSFYIGEGTGADGISLTALDVDRQQTFLGGDGCGIGYGGDAFCTDGPALPGWSIEVDTYYNEGHDPTSEDHLMLTFDGDVDDPEIWMPLPKMEGTGWHTMAVRIQQPHVQVDIDGVTYIDQEIVGHYDFDAYIGFTAGTGDFTNRHLIRDLVVQEKLCSD